MLAIYYNISIFEIKFTKFCRINRCSPFSQLFWRIVRIQELNQYHIGKKKTIFIDKECQSLVPKNPLN